jgi:molecular chaperone GrpE
MSSGRKHEGSGEENNQPFGAKAPDGSTPVSASPTPSPPPVPEADSATPKGGEEEKLEAEMKDLVAGLERERDEYLELARRTKADFENYRKRVDREASEAEARGRAALARSLLSVVDNLERALAAAEPRDNGAPSHIAEGVRLVHEELSGVLANAGVESFSPVGEQFDPQQHEAMLTRPGKQGEVLEVLQKGYRLNGQVLRPARVVVGSADQSQPSGGERPAG